MDLFFILILLEVCRRVGPVDIPEVEVRVDISSVEEDIAVNRDIHPLNRAEKILPGLRLYRPVVVSLKYVCRESLK